MFLLPMALHQTLAGGCPSLRLSNTRFALSTDPVDLAWIADAYLGCDADVRFDAALQMFGASSRTAPRSASGLPKR